MKNKALIYFVAVVVLLVWGKVIYDLTGGASLGEETTVIPNFSTPEEVTQQQYELSLDFPDPFLRGKPNKKDDRSERKVIISSVKANLPEDEKEFVWPNVDYQGKILKKQKGEHPKAIIVYKGKTYFMLSGDSLDAVKVKAIFNDSIIFSYNEKDKTYLR